MIVLDSSAVLAVLRGEPGGSRVVAVLPDSIVSSVNIAEVHTKLVDGGMDEAFAWSQVLALGSQSYPFDDVLARAAGALVRITRPYGLSLGDRACLALAIDRKATVYTTDKIWMSLNLGINVEVIR